MDTKTRLTRKAATINRLLNQGATVRNTRLMLAVYDYTAIKHDAIEANEWRAYCEANGFDTSHDGYDLLA